jgi:CheY-like chemotaxis protein
MARILIIEDESTTLDLMSYVLRAFGHTVVGKPAAEEGLAEAARERPDLILCDLHLGALGGLGVLRRLKADPDLAGIPVVAATALAMVGDRERLLAAGFDGYLPKPIDPRSLIEVTDGFLPADRRGRPPR